MSASTERTTLDPKVYRDTIGHFATGVAVITTEDETGPQGMTVNSLTSVSLDPTLLLVCLTRGSRTSTAIRSTGSFVVNVLSHRQIEVSNTFARPSEDHFEDVEVRASENGLPALVGNLATLGCNVWRTDEGGDHEIVIGEVQACEAEGGDPLVFFAGRYARQIGIDEYPVPNWWA